MPFTNPIVAGEDLVRPSIRSPDYIPGVSGWTINRDGSAEFNNINIRGEGLFGTPGGQRVEISNTGIIRIYDTANNLVVQLDKDGLQLFGPSTASHLKLLLLASLVVAEFQPPAVTGLTLLPGTVYGDSDPTLKDAWLALSSATINGGATSAMQLYAENSVTGQPAEINLDADRVSINRRVIGAGAVARDYANTPSAAVTAETVVLTTTAATYKNNHAYRVTTGRFVRTSDASGRAQFQLRKTNVAGQQLGAAITPTPTVATGLASAYAEWYLYNATGADLTGVALALTLENVAGGATTATHFGSTTNPRYLYVEDVGLAADYDFGVALV